MRVETSRQKSSVFSNLDQNFLFFFFLAGSWFPRERKCSQLGFAWRTSQFLTQLPASPICKGKAPSKHRLTVLCFLSCFSFSKHQGTFGGVSQNDVLERQGIGRRKVFFSVPPFSVSKPNLGLGNIPIKAK